MFCKHCGSKIDRDSIFCSYCGTKQTEFDKVENNSYSTKGDNKTLNVNLTFGKPKLGQIEYSSPKTRQSKYDNTYEKESGVTVLGIFLFFIPLVFLIVGLPKYVDDSAYYTFKITTSLISLLVRIFVVITVVGVSKRQNRDTIVWGVFAFFLPSIALIIIGQLKKIFDPNQVVIDEVSKNEFINIDLNSIQIPEIQIRSGNKIQFSDGQKIEIIKDIQDRYFFISNDRRQYYKNQEATIKAAYIYKLTNRIYEVDSDND
jgi:hypothetical protein